VEHLGAAQKLQPLADDSSLSGDSVLDRIYLNRVTFGDAPLRQEVVGLFLAQVNGMVRTLNLSIDASTWQFLTHTLKGAAVAVGATQMAEIAVAWEKRGCPQGASERSAVAAELRGAVLAFEHAAAQLH
jgi:HPt (histidine-containing phosphotransfer) domain-containing protein